MDQKPQGPLFENLVKLKGMLPKMVKGMKSKKLVGGAAKMLPTKQCRMCDDVYDKKMVPPGRPLDKGWCPRCQVMIDDGHTAVRYVGSDPMPNGQPNRVWIKLPPEAGMPDNLQYVGKEEMIAINKVFDRLANAKNQSTDPVASVCSPRAGEAPRQAGESQPDPDAGTGGLLGNVPSQV